jgi:hypothetical protein
MDNRHCHYCGRTLMPIWLLKKLDGLFPHRVGKNGRKLYHAHGKYNLMPKPLAQAWVSKDHVVPKSKGGTDSSDNLVPCCMVCNISKGAGSRPSVSPDPFAERVVSEVRGILECFTSAQMGHIGTFG